MTYTFADLRKAVLKDVTTSTDYFGESIRYRAVDLDDGELTFDAHCKHTQRLESRDDGSQVSIEELTVTIDRDSLPREPKLGDLVYRGIDEIGFLHAYNGGDQPHYWRRVYKREKEITKGSV